MIRAARASDEYEDDSARRHGMAFSAPEEAHAWRHWPPAFITAQFHE